MSNLTVCKAGDIIGTADNSWLSRTIRSATGNGPCSHIMIVTSTSPFVQVTEALDHVKVSPLEERLEQMTIAYLMSPLKLTNEQRIQAAKIALSHVTDRYDYADLLLQELDSLTRSTFWTDHFAGEPIICSALAAMSLPSYHLDVDSIHPNGFYYRAMASLGDLWSVVRLK